MSMQSRTEVDRDERMLHRNADHANALMSFCTRTTQQVSGLEDEREGAGDNHLRLQRQAAGIYRLSKNHTFACAKRVLVANPGAGRIASIDKASKDRWPGRIDRKPATLRWQSPPGGTVWTVVGNLRTWWSSVS
jgi:hypothetical protein